MASHFPHILAMGDWDDASVQLSNDQIHHLERVLRLKPGVAVGYTDGKGTVGRGVYQGGRIARDQEGTVPRPSPLTMAVPPPASRERCRFLVEKLAELGVARLVWLSTRFGEGHVPHRTKAMSWAASALEQSRGGWLMEIGESLVAWEGLQRPLVVAVPGGGGEVFEVMTVAIGPEGGLDPAEIPADAATIDLGLTILRVETAAVVAATRFTTPWHGGS